MLTCLRHDRFVRRNDQHDEIDSTYAGEHVLDETLVAWNIHKREIHVADREMRKPQVDRDPARFLFLEPIRIGSCQRLNKRTLAMIDVTRCANNNGFHRRRLRTARSRLPGRCFARFSCLGTALLRRGPRSPSRTRSRMSTSPRSIWRTSMFTRMTWTATLSPRR